MTEISLESPFFAWARSGRKRSTIRNGVKPYTLGVALLQGFGEQAKIFITKLEIVEFCDLTRAHAHVEGYQHLDELQRDLRRIYPRLHPSDRMTLVEFDLVDPNPTERAN